MTEAADRIPLRLKRLARARIFQRLQHVLAAGILIEAALRQVRSGERSHLAFAIAEIVAAAVVLASIVVSGARETRGAHSRLGWTEIFGAVMVLLEGYARHRYAKRFFLFHPEALQALALFISGALEERLATVRYLAADSEGLRMRLSPWRRPRARWEEIRSARRTSEAWILETGGAPIEIPLSPLTNPEEVSAWVEERLVGRSIPLRMDEPPEKR